MKKLLFPLGFLVATLILASISIFWWSENSKAVSSDTSFQDFLVVRGKSASQIGEALYKQGLIKKPLAFKVYVQVSGKASKIQAGQFRISPSFTLTKVVDTLTNPPVEFWVTIPEGLRREEVVERFIKGLELKDAVAVNFRQEFLDNSEGQEGFLFPDTYLFPRTASGSAVVTKMTNTFDSEMIQFHTTLLDENAAGGLDNKGLVTLASIIERETKTNDERPVVAGILFNRLEIGMGLQADATVQYAAATAKCRVGIECDWWPVLTKDDLSINSPFNTYRFRGLPPAPIASPGLSSIRAVIHPEETDYLYYLHDADGGIHYAKTLAEHNDNVKVYLGK